MLYTHVQLEIANKTSVEHVILNEKLDCVVHRATLTAVYDAEEGENQAKVYRINADSTRCIAEACKEVYYKMAYISLGYVFNCEGSESWRLG